MSSVEPDQPRDLATGFSKLPSDRMDSSPPLDRDSNEFRRQEVTTPGASPLEVTIALPVVGNEHPPHPDATGQIGGLGARGLQSRSDSEDRVNQDRIEPGRVVARSLPQLDYARPDVLDDQRRVARAWRTRPLEAQYAAIYDGVIEIVVREGPLVHRKELSVITALTMSGAREVISLDVRDDCEGDTTARRSKLLERGLQDVLAIVIDDPVQADAWATCFPRSRICPSLKAVAADFGIRQTAFIKGIERLVDSAVAGADQKRGGLARRRSSRDPFGSDPPMSPAEREKLALYVSYIAGFPKAWRRILFVWSAVSPIKARLHNISLRLPTSFPDNSSALDRMSLIMRMLSVRWRLAPSVWSPIRRNPISPTGGTVLARHVRS